MCGICGIIDYNKSSSVSEEVLYKMCKALEHRGPDDEGIFINTDCIPSIGLGHRRLSIIDLSPLGHQPMPNEDKSIWIILNGEIYNFHELKNELEEKGHIFRSHTDTETVIHLYEEYGEDCLAYLRGMFAFAIWDNKNKKLFMARDRFGKKPLLYYVDNGVFCFASEFLALLESRLVPKDISEESLHYYLTFGYIPSPRTIYKKVSMLSPGHKLVFSENKVSVERYWHLDYSPKIMITEKEAEEEIIRLLKDSIKIRMRSDVELGAFLSGGVDSSAVVALMSELSRERVKTFSIGFDEASYNELRFARNIAKRYNTDHHEFIVKPNALEILPALVEHYGQPYADSSCIPTYYVAEIAKRHVTVVLNGDGGDELFAGYVHYQAMIAAEYYNQLPRTLKKFITKLTEFFPDTISSKNMLQKARRYFQAAGLPTNYRYLRWCSYFDFKSKDELYSGDFKKKVASYNPINLVDPYFNANRHLALLDNLLDADISRYLPDDLLVKVDITSMMNSLEARSPFLDHKLAEFIARLPINFKIRGLEKKYILKKAIGKFIPKENIYRRKMGFGVPVGQWLTSDLKGFLIETVLSSRCLKRGYFNPNIVRNIIHEHTEKKANHSFKVWTLLMLELWHQKFAP